VCPTELELRSAHGAFDDSLNAVVWEHMQTTGSTHVITTMGEEGLIAFEPARAVGDDRTGWATRVHGEHVPALGPTPIDTLGCGDALLAAATLALVAGGSLTEAAFIGAAAAAEEAGHVGNVAVTADELCRAVRRFAAPRLAIANAARTDSPAPTDAAARTDTTPAKLVG
jgi:sugar/nucleoside kinase (ribokinase family)